MINDKNFAPTYPFKGLASSKIVQKFGVKRKRKGKGKGKTDSTRPNGTDTIRTHWGFESGI